MDEQNEQNESKLIPDDLKQQLAQQQVQLQACGVHQNTPLIGVLVLRSDGEMQHIFVCPMQGCPIPTPFNQQAQGLVRAQPTDISQFLRRNSNN